jgi:hypothetical protein
MPRWARRGAGSRAVPVWTPGNRSPCVPMRVRLAPAPALDIGSPELVVEQRRSRGAGGGLQPSAIIRSFCRLSFRTVRGMRTRPMFTPTRPGQRPLREDQRDRRRRFLLGLGTRALRLKRAHHSMRRLNQGRLRSRCAAAPLHLSKTRMAATKASACPRCPSPGCPRRACFVASTPARTHCHHEALRPGARH